MGKGNNFIHYTNLPSLKQRRTQASLCHLFKIIHGDTEFADAPVYLRTANYYNTRSSDSGVARVWQSVALATPVPIRTVQHSLSY